jgi:hypothetical protein
MNARVMNANAVVISAIKHPQNISWDGFWSDSFMGGALSEKSEGGVNGSKLADQKLAFPNKGEMLPLVRDKVKLATGQASHD